MNKLYSQTPTSVLNILKPSDNGKTTEGTKSALEAQDNVYFNQIDKDAYEMQDTPFVRIPKSFYTKSKKRPYKGTARAKRATRLGGNQARA